MAENEQQMQLVAKLVDQVSDKRKEIRGAARQRAAPLQRDDVG
jgi:hypothetical protein